MRELPTSSTLLMDLSSAHNGPSPAAPYCILVVDDDPDMRAYLRLCLVALYGVSTVILEAEDGLDALEQARTHPPDLIITDLVMPRLDGRGLCRAVRASTELCATPILLISGVEPSPTEAVKGEANAFLPKLFNSQTLTRQVQSLLHA